MSTLNNQVDEKTVEELQEHTSEEITPSQMEQFLDNGNNLQSKGLQELLAENSIVDRGESEEPDDFVVDMDEVTMESEESMDVEQSLAVKVGDDPFAVSAILAQESVADEAVSEQYDAEQLSEGNTELDEELDEELDDEEKAALLAEQGNEEELDSPAESIVKESYNNVDMDGLSLSKMKENPDVNPYVNEPPLPNGWEGEKDALDSLQTLQEITKQQRQINQPTEASFVEAPSGTNGGENSQSNTAEPSNEQPAPQVVTAPAGSGNRFNISMPTFGLDKLFSRQQQVKAAEIADNVQQTAAQQKAVDEMGCDALMQNALMLSEQMANNTKKIMVMEEPDADGQIKTSRSDNEEVRNLGAEQGKLKENLENCLNAIKDNDELKNPENIEKFDDFKKEINENLDEYGQPGLSVEDKDGKEVDAESERSQLAESIKKIQEIVQKAMNAIKNMTKKVAGASPS